MQTPRRNTGRVVLVLIALAILGVIGWAVTRGGEDTSPTVVEDAASPTPSPFTLKADEGFEAVFPTEPFRTTGKIERGSAEVDVVQYRALTEEAAYSVYFADAGVELPAELTAKDAIDRLANEVSGDVKYTNRGTEDGRPSFDFLITHGEKFVRGVVIIDGSRGFVVAVDSSDEDPAGFRRFKRSFRIV